MQSYESQSTASWASLNFDLKDPKFLRARSSYETMELLGIFISALSTVGTIMVLNIIGCLCAMYPIDPQPEDCSDNKPSSGSPMTSIDDRGILKQGTIKQLSRLTVVVFMPALIATSLGKRLTPSNLSEAAVMPVFAVLHLAIAFGVGYLARLFVRPPRHLHRAFLSSVTFQNSSALPLVVAHAMSEQQPLSKDPQAFEKLALYVFVYNVGWQTIFWSIGKSYLSSDGRNSPEEQPVLEQFIFHLRKMSQEPMIRARFNLPLDLLLVARNCSL